jgi:hypothetical protein
MATLLPSARARIAVIAKERFLMSNLIAKRMSSEMFVSMLGMPINAHLSEEIRHQGIILSLNGSGYKKVPGYYSFS